MPSTHPVLLPSGKAHPESGSGTKNPSPAPLPTSPGCTHNSPEENTVNQVSGTTFLSQENAQWPSGCEPAAALPHPNLPGRQGLSLALWRPSLAHNRCLLTAYTGRALGHSRRPVHQPPDPSMKPPLPPISRHVSPSGQDNGTPKHPGASPKPRQAGSRACPLIKPQNRVS